MNILGICWDYSWMNTDKSKGDFETRELIYASYLDKLIRIVYTNKNNPIEKFKKLSSNIRIVQTNSINKLSFIFDALRIGKQIIYKEKIDLISAEDPCITGIIGLILSRIFDIPLNVQIHYDAIDNEYWLKQRIRHRFYSFLAKFVVKRAQSIRVVSEEQKHKLIKIGIDKDKIWVIPVIINISKFTEAPDATFIRDMYSINSMESIILFVGRLSYEKDIPTLLNAFKIVNTRIRSSLLMIVGDGPEYSKLLELTNNLKIKERVLFTGAIDHNMVPAYFKSSDIFVLPSLREARGNVIVEASLCKKPSIVSTGTGAESWVHDGKTGFKIPPKNSQILANKLIFLLENPTKVKEFGEFAYRFVLDRLKKENNPKELIYCWNETIKKS